MSFQKGDFLVIDYVARVKETGEVFDTTIEETAKKEHLYKEGEIYEPKLVVVGEGWVLKALDESLVTMETAKTALIEIPQDKAFGARDPEKVKRIPLRQLVAKGVTPSLGGRVEFGGKTATVRAIGAGRVLLDYNPPLAGKTLIYEVTVKKRLEKDSEKIAALVHRRTPAVEESKFEFVIKGKTASVEIPEEAFYLEGVQLAKRGVALDLQRFFPQITVVKFTETFKTEPKETEAKQPLAKKTEKTGTEKKKNLRQKK